MAVLEVNQSWQWLEANQSWQCWRLTSHGSGLEECRKPLAYLESGLYIMSLLTAFIIALFSALEQTHCARM